MALRDFQDIYTAVLAELKIPSSDTVTLGRIKNDINQIYLDEVVPFKRWLWLLGHVKTVHQAYYGSGSATVTNGSTTVTLSVAPTVGAGSYAGGVFSTDGFDEVYGVASHTAGSTTVVLDSPYQSSASSVATFKMWRDVVLLPADAREVVEVYHQRNMQRTMEGVGFKEFRKIVNQEPKALFFPRYFNVGEFYDTTPNTAMVDTDRDRMMRVYPSLTDQPVTLNIDYTKKVVELSDDGDEPILPLEDRIVLVYGAKALAWKRERNDGAFQSAWQLFERKLGRMAGKIEEGFDKPAISLNSRYLASKRGSRLRGYYNRGEAGEEFGSASAYSPPNYLKDVIIDGANIIANVTANVGITIDGRDVSVDGGNLDSHIAATTNVHGTGVGNAVVGTGTTQTLTAKTMAVGSNHITGTINTIAQFNAATGDLESSGVSAASIGSITGGEALQNISLTDNATTVIESWAFSTYSTFLVSYGIKRSTTYETGIITILCDGSNADVSVGNIIQTGGDPGLTISVDISGGNVRLKGTMTSTGTAGSFTWVVSNKYLLS